MASPTQDPRTGIYYYRRVVPAPLRPFFGLTEYKKSLDTRDPDEARERYHPHAVVYDQLLAAAKRSLLNEHCRAARRMVDDFLEGASETALQGVAMKLASLETGAFEHACGLNDHAPGARYDFGAPPKVDDLRDHRSRKEMLEAITDLRPLPWLETLQRVAALPSMQPIDWAITSIAYMAGVEAMPGSPLHEAIGRAYLDRLVAACAVRVAPSRTRIIPPPVIVGGGASLPPVPDVEKEDQIKPAVDAPTITAVFEDWAVAETRDPKLVDEWRTAIDRFAALHGGLPVGEITAAMVREFRGVYAGLPARGGKLVDALLLRERIAYAKEHSLKTLAPATVNKALSAIRVMLDHAVEDMQVVSENVAKTVKSKRDDSIYDARLPFEPEDMRKIFSSPLPAKEGVSVETLFWILLLAPFTGGRLEELGTLRPGNLKEYDGIPYIAIEPDRLRVREQEEGRAKRAKTSSAKRDIPIHSVLIGAGFLDFVAKRKAEGAQWLFPELKPNKHGSRTARLSRVLNDFLDAIGLSDPELVFYSFRHTAKRAIRGKVDREIVDLLFGHADGKVSSKYGRGAAMDVLRDGVEKITFPEVDWAYVTKAAPVTL